MILRDFIILPEAERDASEAYTWYEQQESGLGEEFLRCVDACIRAIRRNSEIYYIGLYMIATEGLYCDVSLT